MELKEEFEDGKQDQKEEERQHFHVLAVDDSLIDRKLLERLLTVSSYQVTCVESVDKALEYLGLVDDHNATKTDSAIVCSSSCSSDSTSSSSSSSKQEGLTKVNLIMTDYSMPGMSGYDLLKKVKGSSWKDVPVVVMSSENVPSRINMCMESGAEEFILKPIKLSDLRKLQSHIHNSFNNSPTTTAGGGTTATIAAAANGNSINANKRKAMSPENSERRPKLKELAVV